MNATPDHLDDEVLSALLDGAAAGADAGAVDAAAHVGACDRCAGRQGELAAARVALAGAPVEAIDELTRRRLVAAALQAGADERPADAPAAAVVGRSRWASRHTALIGSAAAVVLALLVGIPFVVGDDRSPESGSTLDAGAPESANELAASFLGDLGDLSDRDNLRLRLAGGPPGDPYAYNAPLEPGAAPAAGARSAAPAASQAPKGGGLASTTTMATPAPMVPGGSGSGTAEKAAAETAADAVASSDPGFAGDPARRDADRTAIDSCVASLLNGAARGGRLTASGTGTFQGRPAIVAVFELSGGQVAFVADRSSCAVYDRFSV